MSRRRSCAVVAVGLALLLTITPAFAQDLGHRVPGLLGLDAGRIPEPGLYLVDRLAIYEAENLRDRNGNLISTAHFNLLGIANAFGASYTTKISGTSMFLMMTVAGPIAKLKLNIENRPEIGVDRLGLGDPYIQPFRMGWRKQRFDLVTSYGIYLPMNTRQRGIDITRGDSVQIEGGLGANCSENCWKPESPDMPYGRCATTMERNCHLCLPGHTIESMDLGRKAPCSSSRFRGNSECVTNGISVFAQGRKDTSSWPASISSCIAHKKRFFNHTDKSRW